jgi:pimeloyl-ACP methyl ester carboxylesterase
MMLTTAAASPATETMKTVVTPLGTLAYREGGAGPPLVLLHAAGHDHHDFDAVFDALASTHHVLALDFPGHGGSAVPQPPSSVTVMLLAQALEAFVDALALGPAVFLGNSVGGYAAMVLALKRPEHVAALVLVDTGGFQQPDVKSRWFCAARGTEWVNRMTWNVFPQTYLRKRNPFVDAILRREKSARSDERVAVNAALWRSFMTPEHDLRKRAAGIRVPTLLVWGRDDPVIAVDHGERAARTIPDARLVVLPTGHMPFAENPRAFMEVAAAFLASQRNGGTWGVTGNATGHP